MLLSPAQVQARNTAQHDAVQHIAAQARSSNSATQRASTQKIHHAFDGAAHQDTTQHSSVQHSICQHCALEHADIFGEQMVLLLLCRCTAACTVCRYLGAAPLADWKVYSEWLLAKTPTDNHLAKTPTDNQRGARQHCNHENDHHTYKSQD